LVLFQDSCFAVDEGGEEAEVLGGELSSTHARGLGVEALDEVIDFLFGNGGLDSLGVILQDAHQALLYVLPVDVLGVFQEEIDPTR
jgi:hypothetical protein